MRAINPSRIATNIFQRANRFNFCVGFAPADPRKHTTMHHYINDMYLDLWEYGNYPDWVHIGSIPPRTYEPQVVDTLASTLNAQLVNISTLREPTFQLIFSILNAIGYGLNSFLRISTQVNLSMNSIQQF